MTIPGTYPLWALRMSSKIVSGRRILFLGRFLWMVLTVVVTWALVLIPAILFDMGIKKLFPVLDPVAIVPFITLVLAGWSALWSCMYTYVLYRKVVDAHED